MRREGDLAGRVDGRRIEAFYGISSPWAYLGAPRLFGIADRHGAELRLRPIKVIEPNGGIPLRTRPTARQHYHAVELDRWRRLLDRPLNLKPRFYPCRTILNGACAVIAAQAAGLDARTLSYAIQRALWAEDRDIADPAVLREIARENGMEEAAALIGEEPAAESLAEWAPNLRDAEMLGIFGTPTYVYREELFWGQDRLDFLDRALDGAPVATGE